MTDIVATQIILLPFQAQAIKQSRKFTMSSTSSKDGKQPIQDFSQSTPSTLSSKYIHQHTVHLIHHNLSFCATESLTKQKKAANTKNTTPESTSINVQHKVALPLPCLPSSPMSMSCSISLDHCLLPLLLFSSFASFCLLSFHLI